MGFRRVLITSGPTAVPVDGMRVITNRSTGEMGRLLAREISRQGAHVTLLEGASVSSCIPLDRSVTLKKFFYYDELARFLPRELKRGPDIVIHAAAVSDFKLAQPFVGKLASGKALKLDLVPTRKLISGIKKTAPRAFLVGFKLETRLTKSFILDKIKNLFEEAQCDVVVANTQKAGKYSACLIWPDGWMSPKVSSKKELVRILVKALQIH